MSAPAEKTACAQAGRHLDLMRVGCAVCGWRRPVAYDGPAQLIIRPGRRRRRV